MARFRTSFNPATHLQVIRAMWDEPPPTTLPLVKCPVLLVPAGPRPERAGSGFALMREEMVEMASKAISQLPGTLDTQHHA